MAFVKIIDLAGETELIVFPKTYAQTMDIWIQDNIVIVKAKVDFSRNDELKLLVEEVKLVSEDEAKNFDGSKEPAVDEQLKRRLYIRLEDSSNQPKLLTLKQKLDGYSGDTEVVLVTGAKDSKQIIKLPQTISISEESLRDLASIFGSTNVVVR
jgi:DNA polymerase-3 subunit alpha